MHLWSVARYDLQLSDDAFYAMTPRQFHALLARNKEERLHRELLVGIATSSIVNHSFCSPKKPHAPKVYMPSLVEDDGSRSASKPKRVSLNRQFNVLFGALAPYRKPCQN